MTKVKIPKSKMLIGVTKKEDYYETPRGQMWAYSGTEFKHWKNPKYWERLW